jgi:hypothetical protein
VACVGRGVWAIVEVVAGVYNYDNFYLQIQRTGKNIASNCLPRQAGKLLLNR